MIERIRKEVMSSIRLVSLAINKQHSNVIIQTIETVKGSNTNFECLITFFTRLLCCDIIEALAQVNIIMYMFKYFCII